MHVCVVSECKCRQTPKALDPPVLELQMVGRHLTWVLGTKCESFARATSTLNSWATFPACSKFSVIMIVAYARCK